MSALAIRAAIAATLSKVEGIGVIHNYERAVVDGQRFRKLFTSEGRVLGWTITRTGVRQTVIDSLTHRVNHSWRIRGWMGLADEAGSELIFDDLIERVRGAFLLPPWGCPLDGDKESPIPFGGPVGGAPPNGQQSGVVESPRNGDEVGLQLVDFGAFTLAGILCHAATLELTTAEVICLTGEVVDDFITGGVRWEPTALDTIKPNQTHLGDP